MTKLRGGSGGLALALAPAVGQGVWVRDSRPSKGGLSWSSIYGLDRGSESRARRVVHRVQKRTTFSSQQHRHQPIAGY